MSGHSKWSTIKRKKGEKDGARAKVFTKISREIIVAVREGGGDPNSNSKLAQLVQKAKSNNIPNHIIKSRLIFNFLNCFFSGVIISFSHFCNLLFINSIIFFSIFLRIHFGKNLSQL